MPHAFIIQVVSAGMDTHFVSQSKFPITVFRMVTWVKIRRIIIVICREFLQSQAKLPHIISALNSLRPSFGLRNCRQQKRRQNSDDCDDNQKFNQRECRLNFWPLNFHHATSTSLVTFAGASLNCAFTLATVFSTDRPYFLRSSSCDEACSMN